MGIVCGAWLWGSGLALAALGLAGCGGGGAGTLDPGAETASSRLASILAFGTPNTPVSPAAADPNAIKLVCPDIDVPAGAAALRSGGPEASSVRFQYSLNDAVRECELQGDRIAIKVGVEGRVLIGPAGSGGSHSVPVRITIQRAGDQTTEVTKVYKVAATVPPGDTQAGFTLVTDPILVPYKHEDATDDYSIVVGFDGAKEVKAVTQRRRRR